MTTRRSPNPCDNGITSDQNFFLRWRFFSNYKLNQIVLVVDMCPALQLDNYGALLELELLCFKAQTRGGYLVVILHAYQYGILIVVIKRFVFYM